MDEVKIRAMALGDVAQAQETSYEALREAGRAYGWKMPELDEAARERGRRRIAHVLEHDPGGAFVAEAGDRVIGVALATRRGPLWFLALLAVATADQATGVGRRLLARAMTTLDGAGLICASDDPKALRRYRVAGFDLVPCYEARGALDRSLLPAVDEVRPASYEDDRDLVEAVATLQRGAPHGPDLEVFAERGYSLFVTSTAGGRGYAVCADHGPVVVGATSGEAAAALLWTGLAEATAAEVEVGWLSHDQQWALDVALAARLSLRPTGSRCCRGPVGPMAPYIPSGGLG
ncbi:MAG: GNAT family N-acetyltransferase [Acidimicrobiales bacterium]